MCLGHNVKIEKITDLSELEVSHPENDNEEHSMKPMLRSSIAAVTVGFSLLMFCGQTRKDVVAAQGGKPVTMYRFYTGKDGLSHVEKIEVKNFDQNNVANLMETTTGATLRTSKPDASGADFGAFHPGPRRQYIFDLAGHEEVEFSGGEKITLNPGDIELIEDLAPTKGHRNRNLGPEDRLVLWVPIADQTVVRDSISK
jgi:hypothetical protein